jgi:tetratricopeptide (TPR) repeat protein
MGVPSRVQQLPADEARVLFRAAVFSNGFREDAAAYVCSDMDIAPADVIAILTRLAQQSLVVADESSAPIRYSMPEAIADFAREQLTQHGELFEMRERHARWALEFSRGIARRDILVTGRVVLEPLVREVENFRAAVAWSFGESRDPSLAWTLVAQLLPLMQEASSYEASRWALRALERIPSGADRAVEADMCCSIQAMRQLRPLRLRRFGDRAIRIFRSLGHAAGLARALRTHSVNISLYFKEERQLAGELSREALAYARESGDAIELTLSLRACAVVAEDFQEKRALFGEALAIARENRFAHLLCATLVWLSETEFAGGERADAYQHGHEARELSISLNSNDIYTVSTANLAMYAIALSRNAEAYELARESLLAARAAGNARRVTLALEALAYVSAGFGDLQRAARLIGFCDARVGTIHALRDPDLSDDIVYGEVTARLREQLGEGEWQQYLAQGRLLSEAAAVAEATVF